MLLKYFLIWKKAPTKAKRLYLLCLHGQQATQSTHINLTVEFNVWFLLSIPYDVQTLFEQIMMKLKA